PATKLPKGNLHTNMDLTYSLRCKVRYPLHCRRSCISSAFDINKMPVLLIKMLDFQGFSPVLE
ncbi:MAG: hypothetical protein Q4B26_18185, partial [Eubacteriales bacterium]|nr:hypothetical protein [Eubacteriales bacterium]